MKRGNIYIIVLLFSLLIIGCSEDNGDSDPTSPSTENKYVISGTVENEVYELGVIEGAKVEVLEEGNTSPVASQTTGADGAFSFELAEGGNYTINVYKPGSNKIVDSAEFESLDKSHNFKFVMFLVSPQKIYGQIVGLEKEPLSNIEMNLTMFNKSAEVLDVQTTTTNSSGNYEFLVDYEEYGGWKLEIMNDDRRFKTDEFLNGLVLIEDKEVNFRQLDDIVGSWLAVGDGIADSSNTSLNADSVRFTIGEDYIIGTLYSPFIGEFTYFNLNDYVINRSASGEIHEILFPVANADTVYNDYAGIYRVDETSPQWTLTLEFVDLKEENVSAPTVSGGFGSSNGGANGDAYVWTFTKRN